MNNVTEWLKIPTERRMDILMEIGKRLSLPGETIEKDWWVTLALNACFSLPYSDCIIFKGGTSLSKGWNLIERFSEDIDLAIDRKFFGFYENISKNQIKNLRKKSCAFISNDFLDDLTKKLNEWNASEECSLIAQTVNDSDKDPQIIEIHYQSVFDKSGYIPQRVLIEISSRSLAEPTEKREINSILNSSLPELKFNPLPFFISCVLPQRTFLEKVFLLHEEFSKEPENIRTNRLTRHLYDLERLMDTVHGKDALKNTILYRNIVAHREKFNSLRGIDYDNHLPNKISIIPPDSAIKEWENDYLLMTQNMIYGEALDFEKLIERIEQLQNRINTIVY